MVGAVLAAYLFMQFESDAVNSRFLADATFQLTVLERLRANVACQGRHGIPSRIVSEVDELRTSLVEARRSMDTSLHPVSLIMSGRITKG